MYSRYEDPWKLEDRLENAKKRLPCGMAIVHRKCLDV